MGIDVLTPSSVSDILDSDGVEGIEVDNAKKRERTAKTAIIPSNCATLRGVNRGIGLPKRVCCTGMIGGRREIVPSRDEQHLVLSSTSVTDTRTMSTKMLVQLDIFPPATTGINWSAFDHDWPQGFNLDCVSSRSIKVTEA